MAVGGATGVTTALRIVTYNVLSSSLASPSYFTHCAKPALKASTRFATIVKKLDIEVGNKSIICLQEVSRKWVGPLTSYCEKNEYVLLHSCYGGHFSGYMGVALCIPNGVYSLEGVDISRLADTAKFPKAQSGTAVENPTGWYQRVASTITSFITYPVTYWRNRNMPHLLKISQNLNADPWKEAGRRENVLVSARIKDRTTQQEIRVGTYHMPCLFGEAWRVAVMNLHAAMCVSHLRSLALTDGEIPFILAGDFNIKPNSSTYQLLTEGSLPDDHPEVAHWPTESLNPADAWSGSRVACTVLSAYKQCLGSEPLFTNYAQIRDDPVFCETLDYIFLSGGHKWSVTDVLKLPTKESLAGVLPTLQEPSDHLMLAANLTVNRY